MVLNPAIFSNLGGLFSGIDWSRLNGQAGSPDVFGFGVDPLTGAAPAAPKNDPIGNAVVSGLKAIFPPIPGMASTPAPTPQAPMAQSSQPVPEQAALPIAPPANVPLPMPRPQSANVGMPLSLAPPFPGGVSQPVPQQAVTPQAIQGQQTIAAQQPMQSPMASLGNGLLDRLTAGTANLTTGGNPFAGIVNSIRGFTTGERTDPYAQAQQAQTATAHALFQALQPVYGANQAMGLAQAAAGNPAMAQALMTEIFSNPKSTDEAAARFMMRGMRGQQGGGNAPGSANPMQAAINWKSSLAGAEAEAKDLGAEYAKQFTGYQTDSAKATAGLQTLGRLRQLNANPNLPQGAAAPWINDARAFAKSFGIDIGNAAPGEEFRAIANKLAKDELGSLGQGVSNSDVAFIRNMNPDLAQTQQGRADIINTMEKIMVRKQEIASLASQYRQARGGMDGFTQYLAKWSNENPLFENSGLRPGQATTINGISIKRID